MTQKLFIIITSLMITLQMSAGEKLVISQWMKAGPQPVAFPVFHDMENTKGNTFEPIHLLEFDHINLGGHFPETGKTLTVVNGKALQWSSDQPDANGYLFPDADVSNDQPQVAYMAVYIQAHRYIHTTLEIKSPHMLRAWLNGEVIGTKKTIEEEENTVGSTTKDLKLEKGKHLLIIKTLKPAVDGPDWKVMANLDVEEPWVVSDLDISLSPLTIKNIDHILEGVKISSIQPSHDGTYYSVSYSRALPDDKTERWTDIKRTEDQKLIHTFRHARVSQLQWLPNSNRISYTSSQNGNTTLFLHDIENGNHTQVLEDMEDFTSYRWAPNEAFIIYSIREEGSKTDTDIRQVLGMSDRQGYFRHRSFLYKFDIASGLHQRLTFGNLTTSLQDISPDSKTILFSQNFPDYTTRPFSRQNMYLMNLATLDTDTLWLNESRGVSVDFSPDGDYLLATGGPSAFGGIGENVPAGVVVNNYDTQAYIYELKTGKINTFTRNFDPSVSSATWHKSDNAIYLVTTDEDYRRLYRYDVKREEMTRVDLGMDYVSSVSLADNAAMAIISASQTDAPERHFSLNLRNMRQTLLENPEEDIYQHVKFGEVKDWDFTTSQGTLIKGRVYYPPDFDEQNKYPVIVYYYAGTTPVGRTFGGRYPFNRWAGHGYVVYVLQPSGAVGFGQEFSAAHVNNWGKTVADEIIEGTQKFLAAHPFTNAQKVGCAGASYGGFMTMLLMTRTDIFAAAISHAGISSISSYWGEGYWGYSYSSEASADSYPWNNHELYINQSPLFHADKITTPLLLLTGDSDTNVPPGESIQLYTALKILDRPVELVFVKDQDHHIITHSKRKKWHNVIMAWWDKQLKDQPQWWQEQFPEKNY
ncbi:MAG: prolyl oligopeptidase family serine peptidase [Bacteroidota bacterium]